MCVVSTIYLLLSLGSVCAINYLISVCDVNIKLRSVWFQTLVHFNVDSISTYDWCGSFRDIRVPKSTDSLQEGGAGFRNSDVRAPPSVGQENEVMAWGRLAGCTINASIKNIVVDVVWLLRWLIISRCSAKSTSIIGYMRSTMAQINRKGDAVTLKK